MTPLFTYSLIAHVLFGISGIACFYAVWMWLMRKVVPLVSVKRMSLIGTIFIVGAWLTGGTYYASFYGFVVKPIVRSGPDPWAHNIVLETKEHVFLFLPFLAFVATQIIWSLGERLSLDRPLRRGLVWLIGTIVVIGIYIALSGITLSGAVR